MLFSVYHKNKALLNVISCTIGGTYLLVLFSALLEAPVSAIQCTVGGTC